MPRKSPQRSPERSRLPPGKKPGPPVGPVGERLFTFMQAAGVTQSELARRTGVPQSRISDLVSGRIRYPRVDRLAVLAEGLDQPSDALTRGLRLPVVRVCTPEGTVDAYDLDAVGRVAA